MEEHAARKTPELLAPAGNTECVYAAVRCGADAVYVGGERFSARAGAVNFSDGELEKAVRYCHLHGVKLYRAMNTILFADEMKDFLSAARYSAEIGVDGLIVQDIGGARLIREILPDMRLNASTQMTVHTPEGALMAKEMGFSRIVAARELSLTQIGELIKTGVEIEVFIHGALCMSVSGQCSMSAMIGSRSANRGMCAQACRLPFSALRGERYDLSLKDLCGIPHIKTLSDMGAASFKIEGRMKRPEYVAAAVTACRAALDGGEPNLDDLRAVFSRSGFTDGYLTGRREDMFGFRKKEDVVAAAPVLPALKESYQKETKAARADFSVKVKRGEPLHLEMICGTTVVSAEGAVPETAIKRSADKDFISRQLDKLGDTVYTMGTVTADIDGGLAVSAAAVNTVRRECTQKMDETRITALKPVQRYIDVDLNDHSLQTFKTGKKRPEKIRIRISGSEQLKGIADDIAEIVIPIEMYKNVTPSERFIVALPRFVSDEDGLKKRLAEIKAAGFERLLCTNLAHVKTGRDMGFRMSGGFGLNIANPFAAETAARLGLSDITASFEAKLPQIGEMCGILPVGVIVYGRLPLMLTRNCPIKQAVKDCKSCTGGLTDRTGRFFPVICGKKAGYFEVLNCTPLMMTDRTDEIRADFAELYFTDESAEEVRRITDCLKNGKKAFESGYTRGLYYRGIN